MALNVTHQMGPSFSIEKSWMYCWSLNLKKVAKQKKKEKMKDYIHSGYKAYGLERKRERETNRRELVVHSNLWPIKLIKHTIMSCILGRTHLLCILFNIFKLFLFVWDESKMYKKGTSCIVVE